MEQRKPCVYKDLSEDFVVKALDYKKQYAHICSQRLTILREILKEKVAREFGSDVPVWQLYELTSGVNCVLMGTLFKEMELKPNILKELGDEYGFTAQPVRDRYVSSNDRLILEDELQQVQLAGNIDVNSWVTGAVVACYGQESDSNKGHFIVEKLITPGFEIPPAVSPSESEKYIMVASGLELANYNCDHIPGLQLLCDYVNGTTFHTKFDNGLLSAEKIVRLIIGGNSLSQSVHERDYLSKAKYLTKKAVVPTAEPMTALDTQLALLTGSIDVDVMPGETDPANLFWPQQPMIRAMFPLASRGGGLNTVTNPYLFSIDGVRFLITSGQNIADIMRYSNIDDPLDAMELTLQLRLIAPTCPDTLACYPLIDNDPFIIKETPHVYICTNSPVKKVRTRWLHSSTQENNSSGVLLVSTPGFAKQQSALLIDINNRKVKELHMG